MKVITRYEKDGYSLEETDLFCPNCGSINTVFVETREGDYYEGPNHHCTSCKYQFTMPSGGIEETNQFICQEQE